MKITIIGGGYVGLVSAVCFANMGHQVTCVEQNKSKCMALQNQRIPFYEPELLERFIDVHTNGNLQIQSVIYPENFESDVIMLAVGTPMAPSGEADCRDLFNAVTSILTLGKQHASRPFILSTKSTVPVGTGRHIMGMVASANLTHPVHVASNPEFLREGSAVHDFFHPDRIIIGTEDVAVFRTFQQLYKGLHTESRPIVHATLETAELSKYAANTFLATKISFINELALLCDKVGADIKQTAKLMGMDGRIGKYFLNPSPGYGGSCFPKDTHALQFIGASNGINLNVVSGAIHANNHQIDHCFSQLMALCQLPPSTVTILGTAFKPNTDDIRESAALKLIDRLLAANIRVQFSDPKAIQTTQAVYGDRIHAHASPYDAAKNSEAIVLATEWNDYRHLDLTRLHGQMKTPNFVDLRLIYSHEELAIAGFNAYILGKGMRHNTISSSPADIETIQQNA
jgi:UDPglucose 6-dehydrogenase